MDCCICDEIYPGLLREFLLEPIVLETMLLLLDLVNCVALLVLLAELYLVFGLSDELTEYC